MGFALILCSLLACAAVMAVLILREELRFRKRRDVGVKSGKK
jgi:hypothetical protein